MHNEQKQRKDKRDVSASKRQKQKNKQLRAGGRQTNSEDNRETIQTNRTNGTRGRLPRETRIIAKETRRQTSSILTVSQP